MLRRLKLPWGDVNYHFCNGNGFAPLSWGWINFTSYSSSMSTRSRSSSTSTKMTGWQIQQYGGVKELMLKSLRQPIIRGPDELLIKVHAASVNPIDVRMMEGYGRNLLNVMRKQKRVMKSGTEFPLTLGRDFSGTVVEAGQGTYKFNAGDEVWGALSAERPGTHAEYTVVSQSEISLKPSNLSHIEAASMPYVAMTTWAALCTVGNVTEKNAFGKRVLILGGSGGIGTFTIQLLRAWGANVTATCSEDAMDFLKSLGAEIVLDYKSRDVWNDLKLLEKFDIILDTVGGDSTEKSAAYLSPWKNSRLITLKSPILANSDNLGIVPGMMKTAIQAGVDTLKGALSGNSIRWAVFLPNGKAMNRVRQMVESEKIHPVVQEVFSLGEGDAAYQKVLDGHLRGKIVIDTLRNS